MENKIGLEPAFPIFNKKGEPTWNDSYYLKGTTIGMSRLCYVANHVKDDFDEFLLEFQEKIVGYNVPKSTESSMNYALWLAKGRTKWRLLQAIEFIKEENILNKLNEQEG